MSRWRKVLSLLLCLSVITSSVAVPVLASNDEYEVIPYSQHIAGDSIVFTDEAGTIIEVVPSADGTYSIAAAGSLILQGVGGVMGSASAVIASPVLPLIALLLASGYYVYSNPGLAEDAMSILAHLSEAAREELTSIVDAGLEHFSLADYPALAEEFPSAVDSVFYTDDGTFRESGITFDPTNMLEYDFDAQYVFGDDLTSTAYKYPLGPGGVLISGTSLSVSLVPTSLFVDSNSDIKHALKIANSVTGASMLFMGDSSEFLEKSCCEYHFTAPAVQTMADGFGYAVHTLGIWVLSECTKLAAGEDCDTCLRRYQSEYFGESASLSSGTYLSFENTGNPDLDGGIFSGQYYGGLRNWQLYRDIALDGSFFVTLAYSAFQLISSSLSYARAIDGTAAIPEEDTPVWLPPPLALQNPNLLTRDNVLNNTWEKEVVEPDAVPDEPATDVTGWLSDILNAIKAIPGTIVDAITALGNAVKAIPDQIVSGLSVMVNWIEEGVLNALKAAFIPSEGFFDDFFNNLKDTFENRFGLLTYPISVLYRFCDSLLSVDEVEPVLSWGSWDYQGTEFISAGSYNLREMVDSSDIFRTIYDIYLVVIDASMVFLFLGFIKRKYNSIISN